VVGVRGLVQSGFWFVVKNVVCGVTAKDGPNDEFAFHMLTTPIDVADFALALRMLENGFQRYLPEPD
jgi:hypothetical protein